MTSRRKFLNVACAAPFLAMPPFRTVAALRSTGLKSITASAQPISAAERRARLNRVQQLMTHQNVAALLIEPGSTLEYFTGVRWHRSERTTVALIPARGSTIIVTPAFEEPSVRETLQVEGDVRTWNEHESPFERIVQGLRDRNVGTGSLAIESTTRFFILDGVRRASPGIDVVSGDALVQTCRIRKTSAELALMQTANDVTLKALQWVHPRVTRGMTAIDIGNLMDSATVALGGAPEFALVLLNEASAFPHGSDVPQRVREGSIVLMDCGCTVHGYQSDISRTWVVGQASARQRKVWDTVKRGQEIALETATLGTSVGKIDDAVRRYYESEGWGPDYRLPGLPHRTGHGIGLDGHEPAYLVHGDDTALAPGMCFSDEPGIYIPGEFGVRLEDCWHMTATGPQTFTPFANSIEQPI